MSTAPVPHRSVEAAAVEAAAGAEEFHSDPERGLGAEDAGSRLAASGPNELASDGGLSRWRLLLGQLSSPILILLMGAGVLSAVLGDVAEALVILAVVRSGDVQRRDGHLVLGQRPRLVRADDGDRAERLHGGTATGMTRHEIGEADHSAPSR